MLKHTALYGSAPLTMYLERSCSLIALAPMSVTPGLDIDANEQSVVHDVSSAFLCSTSMSKVGELPTWSTSHRKTAALPPRLNCGLKYGEPVSFIGIAPT